MSYRSVAGMPKIGRAALLKGAKDGILHLAWGSGEPAWDNPDTPLPSVSAAERLVSEVGRRVPSLVSFASPDASGDIEIAVVGKDGVFQERYKLVETPTPYLYMQAYFGFEEASNSTIREFGVFLGTQFVEGLPPGQRYFTPAEIEYPGLLLGVQFFTPPINRSPSVRQMVDFLLPL